MPALSAILTRTETSRPPQDVQDRIKRGKEAMLKGAGHLRLLKTCTKCGADKVPDDFYRYPRAPDGRMPICKDCKKAYERARRLANPNRVAEYNSQYYRMHSDTIKERIRTWQKINVESTREGRRLSLRRRRGRKLARFVEDVDPLIVLEWSDGACGICGEDVDPLSFHVDHVVPIACGGEHSYANTQPAHPLCNMRKGDRWPD